MYQMRSSFWTSSDNILWCGLDSMSDSLSAAPLLRKLSLGTSYASASPKAGPRVAFAEEAGLRQDMISLVENRRQSDA